MKTVKDVLKQGVLLIFFIIAVTVLLKYFELYMQAYQGLEGLFRN